MGMFDWLICKHPLPDGYSAERFQTKSMDCLGEIYEITDQGTLTCNGVTVDDAHGLFNFYDLDRSDVWHEYDAKFTDGRLVEIQHVQTYEVRKGALPPMRRHPVTR